jgi:hypothetical protein
VGTFPARPAPPADLVIRVQTHPASRIDELLLPLEALGEESRLQSPLDPPVHLDFAVDDQADELRTAVAVLVARPD